jgi:hypothetical protein
LRCEVLYARPPLEDVYCLEGIMGETSDSGCNPALDGMAFCHGVKNDLLGK